jgi:hypothetical protein
LLTRRGSHLVNAVNKKAGNGRAYWMPEYHKNTSPVSVVATNPAFHFCNLL